jgi:DNA-binding NarL/FixJ family response regulator
MHQVKEKIPKKNVASKRISVIIPELCDFPLENIRYIIGERKDDHIKPLFSNKYQLSVLLDREPECVLFISYNWLKRLGIARMRTLIAEKPEVKILLYIRTQDIRKVIPLYRLGIMGFISENSNQAEFHIGLRKLMSSCAFFSQEIVYRLLNPELSVGSAENSPAAMSVTEKRIIDMTGKGISAADIVGATSLNPNTLGRTKKKLCKKLGINTLEELFCPENDPDLS